MTRVELVPSYSFFPRRLGHSSSLLINGSSGAVVVMVMNFIMEDCKYGSMDCKLNIAVLGVFTRGN
jgi:hypothetical protein